MAAPYPTEVQTDIAAIDLVVDALQYSADAAIFYLVPNDGNVVDFRLAYELGIFTQDPLLRAGLGRIVAVLANVPLVIRAMQAWRIQHPNQLMILRIFTVVPTSFLQPADKIILPEMMGPMCVMGQGRASDARLGSALETPMLATLHTDCTFGGISFSSLAENPRNGFFVSGVGFSQTTSELMWQYAAGGLLAFTVVSIAGPLAAGLAGIGLAVGALYVPAGTTLKYLAGLAAGRVGKLVAAAWRSRPHAIEAFQVQDQRAFRRIMAQDIYGHGRTRADEPQQDDAGDGHTPQAAVPPTNPPSFRTFSSASSTSSTSSVNVDLTKINKAETNVQGMAGRTQGDLDAGARGQPNAKQQDKVTEPPQGAPETKENDDTGTASGSRHLRSGESRHPARGRFRRALQRVKRAAKAAPKPEQITVD